MIHGKFFSLLPGLGFERLDVGDDIPDRILVRQRARHGAHQSTFAVLGICAANAAPEFSELRGEVPVIDSRNPRRAEVRIAAAIVAVAGAARGIQRRAGFGISWQRGSVGHGRQRFYVAGDGLHVIIACQAERHRPHAHSLDVVKLHAAHAGAKFFELSFDVPLFHAGNIGRANFRISRPVGVVAGNAGLKKLLAASRRIRRAHAASGEIQRSEYERQSPKRNSAGNNLVISAHADSQRWQQDADISSGKNQTQAEPAFGPDLIAAN
jgi:hypothetical protein